MVRLHRASGVIAGLGGITALATGLWAMAPIHRESPRPAPEAVLRASERPAFQPAIVPLRLAAFDARLRRPPPVADPAPVATRPAPPPPPPPPDEPTPVLLAIVREGDASDFPLTAALYDPVQDRIVISRAGDVLLGRTIRSVQTTGVELEARGSTVWLTLDADGGPRQ